MTIFEMGAGERGGGGRNYEVVTVLHRFSLYLTRNSYGGWIFGGGGGVEEGLGGPMDRRETKSFF